AGVSWPTTIESPIGAGGHLHPRKTTSPPFAPSATCPPRVPTNGPASGQGPTLMGDRAMKTPRRAARAALTLDECRIQPSLLLKALRSDDGPRAGRAAERFRILPHFRSDAPDAIFGRRASIRLKHALAVVAAELGFPAWADCKRRLETPANERL